MIGHLTKTQVNEVADAVRKVGLDLDDFEWRRPLVWGGPDRGHPELRYTGSQYYFQFRWSTKWQKHSYSHSPAAQAIEYSHNHAELWPVVMEAVYAWAQQLKSEVEAPDVWRQFVPPRDSTGALTVSGGEQGREDEPFTPEEQRLLEERIDAILERLDQFGIDGLQARRITRDEFQTLKEEVSRLRRGSWLRLAVGTIAKLVFDSVIGTEPANKLLQWLTSAVEEVRALIAGV